MTQADLAVLVLSHGLTYVLLSDIPLDQLEDEDLRSSCERARTALTEVLTHLYHSLSQPELPTT